MRLRAFLVLMLLLTPTLPVGADSLELDGQLVQGGLSLGLTEPGAAVSLEGRAVRVAEDGRFLLGFGRDAPAQLRLEIGLPDGRRLERTLEIARRDYDIQHVDGLPQKMVTPPAEVLARIRDEADRVAEARAHDRPERWFEDGFVWPAAGRLSGVYGSQRVLNGEPKRPHFGVDIAAPVGTPVWAPADAIVTLAEPDLYYSGGTVILDHGHGLTSSYLHMSEVLVTVGQRVARGEAIGAIGAAGRATGAHLDWRFNWFDQRLDAQLLVDGPLPEAAD
jgi:murein DD-endopeptidase MepM/ murein hydrolase activator NlpD